MKERLKPIFETGFSLTLLYAISLLAFSRTQRRAWFMKEFNAQCQSCGEKWDDGFMLEYDHIDPKSNGGNDVLENANLLCQSCHRDKHLGAGELQAANTIQARINKTGGRNIHYKK